MLAHEVIDQMQMLIDLSNLGASGTGTLAPTLAIR